MSDTLNNKLAAFFRAHPGEWLDGKVLAGIAGYAGYRNRITDLRLIYHMTIENNPPRKVHQSHCQKANISPMEFRRIKCTCQPITVSEYRYLPDPPGVAPSEGHDQNAWTLR